MASQKHQYNFFISDIQSKRWKELLSPQLCVNLQSIPNLHSVMLRYTQILIWQQYLGCIFIKNKFV